MMKDSKDKNGETRDPEPVCAIELPDGQKVIVSEEDYAYLNDRVWKRMKGKK